MGHEASMKNRQRDYDEHSNTRLADKRKHNIDVSLSSVCPATDNEPRHNVVRVAVDSLSYHHVNPQLLWQCYDEIHHQ